jgi:fucose permease
LYGFGPVLPLLRDELHLSRTVAGFHGTMLAIGAIVAGLVFHRLVARVGRGVAMWLGVGGMSAGVAMLCATSALPATLGGALVAGLFGSVVVNGSSAILSDHHGHAASGAITEANAFAAGFGMAGPVAVGAAIDAGLGWRPALLVVLALAAVIALSLGRVRVPNTRPPQDVGEATPHGRLPGRFWVAWGVLVACIGVEFCLTLWSSDVLRTRAGLAPGPAAAGVTAVVAGMLTGRVAGGRLALKYDTERLLLGAIALAGVGFTAFWISTAPLASLAGLYACGLGVALHFPLGIARAIATSGGRPDLATARASLGAGVAVASAPFALGALGDVFGTHTAFLIVPALLAVAAAGVHLVAPQPRADTL